MFPVYKSGVIQGSRNTGSPILSSRIPLELKKVVTMQEFYELNQKSDLIKHEPKTVESKEQPSITTTTDKPQQQRLKPHSPTYISRPPSMPYVQPSYQSRQFNQPSYQSRQFNQPSYQQYQFSQNPYQQFNRPQQRINKPYYNLRGGMRSI
jgi:hypothetical protein